MQNKPNLHFYAYKKRATRPKGRAKLNTGLCGAEKKAKNI